MSNGIGSSRRQSAPSPTLLLPGIGGGPAPWVVAVMTALALLALAAAAALAPTARALGGQLAGRVSIQLLEGDAIARREAVAAVRRTLADADYAGTVRTVPEAELADMAERWLGSDVRDAGLPMPALIDVDLVAGGAGNALADLRRDVARVAPQARVVPHADWLAPVARLFRSLALIAVALALLLLAAAVAVAVVTVRGALAVQRPTIDILHLVGATDVQVARLFQRQVARDMVVGVALGTIVAAVLAALIGWQLRSIDAGLSSGDGSWWPIVILLLVPPLFIALTVATTRWTVLRALRALP